MVLYRFILILLLLNISYAKEIYTLRIKNSYRITVNSYPIVGVVSDDYIDQLNENPMKLEPPDTNVTRIIQNFFTIWNYNRYNKNRKKYEMVSIFKYDNSKSKIIYFFYLNVLIQLDLNKKSFVKISFFRKNKNITYESGDFTINELEDSSKTDEENEIN